MHLPNLNYDCVSCGKSCRDLQVEVTSQDLPRLRNSPTTQALEKAGFTPLQLVGSQVFLDKVEGGGCRYLTDETLCSLHQEGGFAHKPRTCQDFPFVPMSTPDGVFVGLSFYCTAVAESQGRILTGRQAELTYLLDSPRLEAVEPDSQWSLWETQAVDWSNYLNIEKFCATALSQDPRHGLLQAAWRLGAAVRNSDLSFLSKPMGNSGLPTDLVQQIARRMIGRMESADESVSQVIEAAIGEYHGFQSLALGHRLELVPLPVQYPDWLAEELARYQNHVLFRKSLLAAPNVLSRVCLLALAGELIATYAYGVAAYRKRELEPQDYYKAVGVVEGRLMLHAFGMEDLIEECARAFLDLSWAESA
jgi:Fe-S-cluster containining protein